ncbi:hypothetical protein CEXT_320571 [Caerostris extrusa]|uniref:Uncharacterized protein n=1 Tax=Caerostris extrusa TaxID=172846 RepID=A0AAV4WGY6_CAEEX|nr:hypothetical protein CEXT_320571 [Caerostris extrusa]
MTDSISWWSQLCRYGSQLWIKSMGGGSIARGRREILELQAILEEVSVEEKSFGARQIQMDYMNLETIASCALFVPSLLIVREEASSA